MAAEDEKAAAAPVGAEGAEGTTEGQPAEPPKKKRGKPKDEFAPPKPKNPYQRVTGEARPRLKEERPELAMDLKAMGLALKEEWEKVPEDNKAEMQKVYEEEMAIWKPKWAEYKLTPHYKEFFEIKQDWVDGRQLKKLVKKLNKDAPKRPKSGYMIYAGEIRERVQKEVMEAGGGMGDIGRKISEYWAELSEAKKAEYGEQSARQKEVFDVEFNKYRKSEAFGIFCDEKAKLQSKQELKKIIRTKLDEMPKRAPSGYSLFKNEVMPAICEENKGLSCGELGKKVSEKWSQVPDEKKAQYAQESVRRKADYDEKLKAFKKKQIYLEYLERRQKVKSRENKLVNLREMPKKPKSVFAMFAEDHKKEVEPGKGEGKGASALKAKWLEFEAEKKAEYEAKEKALKGKWVVDLKEFKEGPKFNGWVTTEKKIKTEFMNEAMKVMTLRFLDSAPPAPPKTAFAVFVGEKRKAQGESDDAKKSKEAKKEEVVAFKAQFAKLDKDTRAEYEVQRKSKIKEWEGEVKEYMNKPKWQEYLKEAKRIRVPVKNLLMQKRKAIKKLKSGLTVIPPPSRPEDYPSKPPGPYKLFVNEKKLLAIPLDEIAELWKNLDDEGKKKYMKEAEELENKFREDLKLFKESDEGKAYFRGVKATARRNRITKAKFMYLKDMPKKPPAAIVDWMKTKASELKKEEPGLKGFEIKRKLAERWQNMDESEKKPLEDAYQAKQKEFQESMGAFKSGENWSNFTKAIKVVSKSGGGPPPPAKPDSMPQKPLDAFKFFCTEQKGSGKALGDLSKMFRELPEEERSERNNQARERVEKYQADMAEFNNSVIGKKYRKSVEAYEKRKRLGLARAKYMKNEPKRPLTAYFIFVQEKRPDIQTQFPDLKGLGPIQQKMNELWKGLSEEERTVWTEKEKEKKTEHDNAVEEFHNTPDYKRYQAIFNRLTRPQGKVKVKEKIVKNMEPPKPENLPVKPPASGFFLFVNEKRDELGGGSAAKMKEAWAELGADGQKKCMDDVVEKNKQYEQDMKAFSRTLEGKKYLRLKAAAEKKDRIGKAKARFLGGKDAPKEPKRPPSAYFIFVSEKRSTLPPGKISDIAKQLTEMWKALSAEDKKVYEDKAQELKEQYEKDLAEYKNSAGFKKFDRAMKAVSAPKPKAKPPPAAGGGGRGRGRGGGGGRGRGAPAAAGKAAADSESDSDVMGSDSDSNSSSGGSSD